MGSFWYLPKGWCSTAYGLLATCPNHSSLIGFTWKCDLSGTSLQGCAAQLESCDFAQEKDEQLGFAYIAQKTVGRGFKSQLVSNFTKLSCDYNYIKRHSLTH